MTLITKEKIQHGVYWVTIPEVDLRILCGCPVDSIKQLRVKGFTYPAEKQGVPYESGPNAILLSDAVLQNGMLSNMTEFPVLHMFYRQGMLIPGHPNNDGFKPLLIGKKEQVEAQMKYIYRGSYGLTSLKEYEPWGVDPAIALQNLRSKLHFAYGRFKPSNELMEGAIIGEESTEIRPGVFILRKAENIFEISYKDETVCIDLNLSKGERYLTTYSLPPQTLPKAHFAVIHSGEGDGWDPNRPCLGSIIRLDGKTYIIDAGPNILMTLEAFGLDRDDIDGIFFTHTHDDHFSGLSSLLNKEKKLSIFAAPTIYGNILQKLSALFNQPEEDFIPYFDYQPLQVGSWNSHVGMEILPILSPHPVDTTIFIFRVKEGEEYRTYGHFSDITALTLLKKMVTPDPRAPGISEETYQELVRVYGMKLTLKKVDVGGPTIHGDAEDFINDPSDQLVLSHTTVPLNPRQLEIGQQAQFGDVSVLIAEKSE